MPIGIRDLDLPDVAITHDPETETAQQNPYEPVKLVAGSVTAQVLYQCAAGTRAIVVNSPPGGGKTTLITHLASYLHGRLGLPVMIAVPRRAQAKDLARRLALLIDPKDVDLEMRGVKREDWLPDGTPSVRADKVAPAGYVDSKGRSAMRAPIIVKTLDSLKLTKHGGRLLIVDESYQVTTECGASAAAGFDQIIAVGDPGQIGPVVPVNTYAWGALAPHRSFAARLLEREDVWMASLPSTYRLGQDTTDAIAPLYSFDFTSCRPDAGIEGHDELEELLVHSPQSPTDPMLMDATVRAAKRLIGKTYSAPDGTSRPIEAKDIVVCAATRSQVTALTARMNVAGLGRSTVGTADEIQGGQWPATVAVDPLAGGHVSDHHADTGRLCVMLSRHIAHLTWVHDGGWRGDMPQITARERDLHRRVRSAVVGH